MTERVSQYAAFATPMGTFRQLALRFERKYKPFCFSRLMDRVLKGAGTCAVSYLNDIAIFSATWEEHLSHLSGIFGRLKSACLTVKPAKCQLARSEVKYLGHVVGQGKRRPDELKVEAVAEFPQRQNKSGIQKRS